MSRLWTSLPDTPDIDLYPSSRKVTALVTLTAAGAAVAMLPPSKRTFLCLSTISVSSYLLWLLLRAPVHPYAQEWRQSLSLLSLVAHKAQEVLQPVVYPRLINLYLLSLIHARRRVHAPLPKTVDQARIRIPSVSLAARMAKAAYGFFLVTYVKAGEYETPRPLPQLVHESCDGAKVLTFNHSLLSGLSEQGHDVRVELTPCYFVAVHHPSKSIWWVVRGSVAPGDIVSDLLVQNVPFGMFDGLFIHEGLFSASKAVLRDGAPCVSRALADNPGYALRLSGHSLGAACVLLMTLLLNTGAPSLPIKLTEAQREGLRCFAFAPPPVVGPLNALPANVCCNMYTFVNSSDIISTLSFSSVKRLFADAKEIDDLDLSLAERIDICRNSDLAALLAAVARADNANLASLERRAPTPPPSTSSPSALPQPVDGDRMLLSIPGQIHWYVRGAWRAATAAHFADVSLAPGMVAHHFPHEYVDQCLFFPQSVRPSDEQQTKVAEETKVADDR